MRAVELTWLDNRKFQAHALADKKSAVIVGLVPDTPSPWHKYCRLDHNPSGFTRDLIVITDNSVLLCWCAFPSPPGAGGSLSGTSGYEFVHAS